MKLRLVTVDLELSRATKKRIVAGGAGVVLVLAAAVAYGEVPHVFQDGQVLSAADLNENFLELEARIRRSAPAGTVSAFAGTNPPQGWLPCDGTALSSGEYPALFAAIGRAWGDGSLGAMAGSGTDFNLPDLRGQFLRGVDSGAGRDPNAGARISETNGATGDAVGSVQPAATAMPLAPFAAASAGEHQHGFADNSGWSNCGSPDGTDCDGANESGHRGDAARATDSGGSHSHVITGGDAETRPRNAAVKWIIKY